MNERLSELELLNKLFRVLPKTGEINMLKQTVRLENEKRVERRKHTLSEVLKELRYYLVDANVSHKESSEKWEK